VTKARARQIRNGSRTNESQKKAYIHWGDEKEAQFEFLRWNPTLELGENVWHVIGKIAKAYNFVVDFIILSSLIGVHTKTLWDS